MDSTAGGNTEKPKTPTNFIRDIIDADNASGKHQGRVVTRFPPEPNGYLHIGHAKSICLNFGLAADYRGRCHLRFDDTNPEKEDVEYVDSIQEDVHWLGFDWGEHRYYASDYYRKLYEFAITLIKDGKAYVCSLTPDEIRRHRGTLTEPGEESPYRTRSVEKNLALFEKMRKGEFEEGDAVLRAKIDMASGNINMRDPIIYRIKKAEHHRTGNEWVIYPMYDFTHCISDSLEGITHSICTLEFENNRPLYDWFLDQLPVPGHPQQIEFARLNLSYTVMSKRKLLELVKTGVVRGWDDPRMPTIAGLRRRGYTPESIRDFCDRIGVAKADSQVDYSLLEHCLREDLNRRAPRVMAVLDPVKVVIENYPGGQVEEFDAVNNPEDESAGKRKVQFTRELYIERDDFREEPQKKFFRMAPGQEVRLKFAYYVTCTGVKKDAAGNVTELTCTYDPSTRGGWSQDGRKVKGTIHWVSAERSIPAEIRLYEHLFTKESPDDIPEGMDYRDFINKDSLKIITARVEQSLSSAKPGDRFQFERTGYFICDADTKDGSLVFNRTASLKDSWAKIEKAEGGR